MRLGRGVEAGAKKERAYFLAILWLYGCTVCGYVREGAIIHRRRWVIYVKGWARPTDRPLAWDAGIAILTGFVWVGVVVGPVFSMDGWMDGWWMGGGWLMTLYIYMTFLGGG